MVDDRLNSIPTRWARSSQRARLLSHGERLSDFGIDRRDWHRPNAAEGLMAVLIIVVVLLHVLGLIHEWRVINPTRGALAIVIAVPACGLRRRLVTSSGPGWPPRLPRPETGPT
jgi:hypothetical protein